MTGASCSATPPRSPPCSIGSSITRTYSSADRKAGGRKSTRTCGRRTPRGRTHESRPPEIVGFACPEIVGFQLSTEDPWIAGVDVDRAVQKCAEDGRVNASTPGDFVLSNAVFASVVNCLTKFL